MMFSKSYRKPPINPYKFLRRSLEVSTKTNAFRNFRVKGFYLKNFLTYSQEEDDFQQLDFAFISRQVFFKNNKAYKTLRCAQLTSFFKPYVHQYLKYAKNLTSYALKSDRHKIPTKTVVSTLRKLPVKVKSINFSILLKTDVSQKDIYDIARSIRRLHNLESFQREFIVYTADHNSYVQKEMPEYSKSVSRLRKIKRMMFPIDCCEQLGFQKAMRKGVLFPGITSLKLTLSPDRIPNFNQLKKNFDLKDMKNEDFFLGFDYLTSDQQLIYKKVQDEINEKGTFSKKQESPDNSDDSISSYSGEEDWVEPRFLARCQLIEEMKPFYRFELFPDLKELEIRQFDSLWLLGSFVIDGFSALKNLHTLTIDIRGRSKSAIYIFKALIQLPLLKDFSFSISQITNEEWALLEHFINIQRNLENLSLCIFAEHSSRIDYLQQNTYLKSTIQRLKNHLSLKSLNLKSPFFSLYTLSKGFSNLPLQLHTFKFQALDDTIASPEKPLKREEGLCQFIKSQKNSLKTLDIDLLLVEKTELVTNIAEAISRLIDLRKLNLSVNHLSLEQTFQEEISPKKWNPKLAKYLKRLENLEDLTLNLPVLSSDSISWFIDLIQSLPTLERLRILRIDAVGHGSLGNEDKKIVNVLLSLSRIKKVFVSFFDSHLLQGFKAKTIAEEINQKQAAKNDYMF